MVKLASLEKKIFEVEGFRVLFKQNGKKIRKDRAGFAQYPFSRKAAEKMTVREYVEKRLQPHYGGFEIEVIDGKGKKVTGQTTLATLRSSYQ